jgi:RNA polymerase sigma-70 factor (ECF subfamily)
MKTVEITREETYTKNSVNRAEPNSSCSLLVPLSSVSSHSSKRKAWGSLEQDTAKQQLQRIAAGNQKAFQEFYQSHIGPLYGYLKSKLQDEVEIREVLQESFLAVWTKASYYRPERGLPIHWLMTIARNKLFDRWRRVQCLQQKLEDFGGEEVRKRDLSLNGEDIFENRRMVEAAMDSLNEEERSLIHAVYLEGKTQKEYSMETNIPLGTIKWRIQKVLSKMKGTLSESKIIGGQI